MITLYIILFLVILIEYKIYSQIYNSLLCVMNYFVIFCEAKNIGKNIEKLNFD